MNKDYFWTPKDHSLKRLTTLNRYSYKKILTFISLIYIRFSNTRKAFKQEYYTRVMIKNTNQTFS